MPSKSTAVVPAKKRVADLINLNLKAIQSVVPRHLDPTRVARIGVVEFNRTPGLQKCDPSSYVVALVGCAVMGLEPIAGEAWIIPFGKKATLIVGYKGLLKLVRNSGQVGAVQCNEVCERDDFEYQYGTRSNLFHRPTEVVDRGPITHFYCCAELRGGGYQFAVMTKAQVDAVKASSPGAKRTDSPWHTHYEEMGKKTAIRRLCKTLPMSIEAQKAIYYDEQGEIGKQDMGAELPPNWADIDVTVDVEPEVGEPSPESRTDQVKQELGATS